jgi:hypothetical protein
MNHRLTTTIAAALALLAPAAAHAQPAYQGYPSYPPSPPPYQAPSRGPEAYPPYRPAPPPPYEAPTVRREEYVTRVRVSPPYQGTVLLYDRGEIIGRFDRPGAMAVPTGRSYRVVAMRGPAVIWTGYLSATGETIDLRWEQQGAPVWPYRQPPLLGPEEYSAFLYTLDAAWDDAERLRLVRDEARQRSFTAAQVDSILPRFHTDRQRLRALSALRHQIVDPENGRWLVRHFRHESARRRALEMLGSW